MHKITNVKDERTRPDLHKHLIFKFTQTFNFCYEKGDSAETGFEFILSNQTDICPLPAAWSWKKITLV
jgi:hypothetical protein